MTDEGKRAAVREELAASEENLAAARLLIEGGILRPAITRVYYAVFHAERALIMSTGAEPRSHEGVHHFLSVLFVVPGRLDGRWSRVIAKLQKYRESADYGTTVVFDRPATEAELAEAEAFCAVVRELLRTEGFLL